jgi:hypothetical protein
MLALAAEVTLADAGRSSDAGLGVCAAVVVVVGAFCGGGVPCAGAPRRNSNSSSMSSVICEEDYECIGAVGLVNTAMYVQLPKIRARSLTTAESTCVCRRRATNNCDQNIQPTTVTNNCSQQLQHMHHPKLHAPPRMGVHFRTVPLEKGLSGCSSERNSERLRPDPEVALQTRGSGTRSRPSKRKRKRRSHVVIGRPYHHHTHHTTTPLCSSAQHRK